MRCALCEIIMDPYDGFCCYSNHLQCPACTSVMQGACNLCGLEMMNQAEICSGYSVPKLSRKPIGVPLSTSKVPIQSKKSDTCNNQSPKFGLGLQYGPIPPLHVFTPSATTLPEKMRMAIREFLHKGERRIVNLFNAFAVGNPHISMNDLSKILIEEAQIAKKMGIVISDELWPMTDKTEAVPMSTPYTNVVTPGVNVNVMDESNPTTNPNPNPNANSIRGTETYTANPCQSEIAAHHNVSNGMPALIVELANIEVSDSSKIPGLDEMPDFVEDLPFPQNFDLPELSDTPESSTTPEFTVSPDIFVMSEDFMFLEGNKSIIPKIPEISEGNNAVHTDGSTILKPIAIKRTITTVDVGTSTDDLGETFNSDLKSN